MTTLADYMRDLILDYEKQCQDEPDRDKEEIIQEVVNHYLDVIKNRLIGEI